MGEVIFGGDDATAGVAVEAMHDAGSGDAADAAEFAVAMMEQRVDQRPLGVSGGGVDDQARGFVEHQQIVILEHDVERDGLRGGGGGVGFGPADGDALTGAGGVGRFDGAAIDADVAAGDEPLNGSTGDGFEAGAQVSVDAFTRVGVFDGQFGFV